MVTAPSAVTGPASRRSTGSTGAVSVCHLVVAAAVVPVGSWIAGSPNGPGVGSPNGPPVAAGASVGGVETAEGIGLGAMATAAAPAG